jgi:hypothetical protein
MQRQGPVDARGSFAARRAALHLALATLVACTGAPLAEPPHAAPPLPPPAAPPPKLGLLDEDVEQAPAEVMPAGRVEAHAGRFEPIPLSPAAPTILAVTGRDGRDVWMLANHNAVLHWDGTRTTERGTPRCFADSCCGRLLDCAHRPKLCAPPSPSAIDVDFDAISLRGGDVIVEAVVDTGGMTSSLVEARLGRDGRWRCEQSEGDGLIHPGVQPISVGGASLQLETPGWLVNPIGGVSLLYDGRRVAVPKEVRQGWGRVGLAARSPDDLWLWSTELDELHAGEPGGRPPRVWRGNGLAWAPASIGFETLTDLWVTDGVVWALGAFRKDDETDLLRWDTGKAAWQHFPAPGATSVRRTGGRDFWLLGKSDLYRWDGRALRRVEVPIELMDASRQTWSGPSGELWVVGADRAAKVTTPKGGEAAGVALRLRAPEEPKP